MTSTPTRLLCIAPFGDYGGSEMVLMRVLRNLDASIEPQLLLLTPGPFADMLRDEGFPTDVENLPGKAAVGRFPVLVRRLAGRYAGRGFGLIHANGIKAAMLGIPLSRRLGIPLVWMKHDHFFDGGPARAVARRCDHVIVVSEAMADQFRDIMGDRLSVIYPGVRLHPPSDAAATDPLAVAVGRLDPRKGFGALLRATKALRERGRDARIQIAGPVDRVFPEHADELQALVRELDLEGHARVGWVDDIDALYERARVVAMASPPKRGGRPSEGAPTVLMEAMAHSRAVVAPRQPGIAEVVGDVGTLVDAPTPEQLADALEPFLVDAQHAARIGALGRERAERLFSFERTFAQLTGLWRDLAVAPAPAASSRAASA